MSKQHNDGGPAFPRPVSEDRTNGDQPDGNSTVSEQDGMTLRDWFAAKAMTGLLAIGAKADASTETVARYAYLFADAMLEARKDGTK